jgi:hypothetical protein
MNSMLLKPVIAAALLGGVALLQPASAAQEQNRSGDAVTSLAPDAQRERTASAALRTLRHITRARSAIHDNDLEQAKQDVGEALEHLELIAATRPAVRLKEHIWVARQHMGYETAQDVMADLMVIDAELLGLDGTLATATARRHLQATEALILNNNTEAARQELDRLEAALIFTEYDLPLAASEEQLLAARQALARNEPAAADKNLVAAEESIQFVTLGGSASLAGARTHLIRAAKNYADEYYAAAREDLAQASEWLRRAGAAGDEKSRQEARKLAAEIDALKGKLEAEADDHSSTLGGFLHRNWVLIEREAQDLWLRYKRQQAANHSLRKLLDARTHLYYAEHDLAKGRNTDIIKKELESTDRYLEEALSGAEPALRERISQLRDEIAGLENGLGGDTKQTGARYDKAMIELYELIHGDLGVTDQPSVEH